MSEAEPHDARPLPPGANAPGSPGFPGSTGPGRGGTARRLCGWLWAALRQRCPRCWSGRMFRGGITMNDPCPVCGLLFQREEGYFLGAMYVSYFLSAALLVPLYFVASALLPGWGSAAVAAAALVGYLPFVPAVFRYSRVLWVYVDRAADPDDSSAGAYEKVRLRQLAGRKAVPPAGAPEGSRPEGPDTSAARGADR